MSSGLIILITNALLFLVFGVIQGYDSIRSNKKYQEDMYINFNDIFNLLHDSIDRRIYFTKTLKSKYEDLSYDNKQLVHKIEADQKENLIKVLESISKRIRNLKKCDSETKQLLLERWEEAHTNIKNHLLYGYSPEKLGPNSPTVMNIRYIRVIVKPGLF